MELNDLLISLAPRVNIEYDCMEDLFQIYDEMHFSLATRVSHNTRFNSSDALLFAGEVLITLMDLEEDLLPISMAMIIQFTYDHRDEYRTLLTQYEEV